MKGLIDSLKKKYLVFGVLWDVMLFIGFGIFEGYVGWGIGCVVFVDGWCCGLLIVLDLGVVLILLDKFVILKSFDIYK